MAKLQKSGILLTVYALLMATFALSWHFLLPYGGDIKNYLAMINDPNWFIVNSFGWFGTFVGVLAILMFIYPVYKDLVKIGKIGVFFVITAFLLHFSLVSWELAIFPVLVQNQASEFIISQGIIMSSPVALSIYSFFSLSFSIGFILFGIGLLKLRIYNKYFVFAIMLGAFLYAFGVAFGGYVGLIVFLLYLSGIAYIGIKNQTIIKWNR